MVSDGFGRLRAADGDSQQGGKGKEVAAAPEAAIEDDEAKVRAWAKENGYNVNDQGRIPADVREAFHEANG